MNIHPIITPASLSLASPHFDVSFDSIESITTSFAAPVVPTLETTTVTEVALGYHRNQQYSITAMTTSTGAVAERYAYTAYGQPTIASASGTVLTSSAIGNRYTYTGREWDETLGLHHFRARWMSPLAGRFLGRDPIGYLSNDLGLYLFTTNSPLSRLDPRGLDWDSGDFWHHYRTGRGDHVTLTQIGLADDFENLHKSRIDGLVDGGLREGETLAGDCSSGPGSYSKQEYTHLPMEYWNSVTSWIFPDPLFSLGNSGMRISKYLEVNWLCESCCASEGAV